MVEKKAKLMSAREERAHNKKNVTKVDPDDDDTNVHRLVQDENAKTILLNFPLEVSFNEKDVSTATSTASKCKPSPKLENHPGDRKQSTSRGSSVDPEKVKIFSCLLTLNVCAMIMLKNVYLCIFSTFLG